MVWSRMFPPSVGGSGGRGPVVVRLRGAAGAAARCGVVSSLAVSAAAVLGAVTVAVVGGVPAHAEGRVTVVAGAGGGVAAERAKDGDPVVVVGGAGAALALVGGALVSGRRRPDRG